MPVFHQRNASRTNKPKITLRELRGLAWGMATSSVGAFVLTVMELFTLSVAPPIAGIWGLLLIPLGGQVGRAVSEGAFHDHSEKLAIIAVIGLLFGYDLGSGVAYFLMRETSAWQLLIALLFGFFLDVLNMADPFAVLGFAGGGYYAYQTAR